MCGEAPHLAQAPDAAAGLSLSPQTVHVGLFPAHASDAHVKCLTPQGVLPEVINVESQISDTASAMHLLTTAAVGAALLLAPQAAAQRMYPKNSPVLQVDAKSFDKLILNTHVPSVCTC